MQSHELGKRGEELAAVALADAGWTVLARNYRAARKEIDLIARCGDVVAFVEVKTRGGSRFGHPLEAVTRAKRREIQIAAQYWIARYGRPADIYRFDAIAILWPGSGPAKVCHVEDAWHPD